MIESYKKFWKKGFDFKGISTRSEYWLAILANSIVYIGFLILIAITTAISENLGVFFNLIFILYALGQIIPSLSILIRRLRDIEKGWQWIFITLIPFIGGIWLIVLLCQPSLPSV